jgi:transcriptional regulator with XRE-family HTH domain
MEHIKQILKKNKIKQREVCELLNIDISNFNAVLNMERFPSEQRELAIYEGVLFLLEQKKQRDKFTLGNIDNVVEKIEGLI